MGGCADNMQDLIANLVGVPGRRMEGGTPVSADLQVCGTARGSAVPEDHWIDQPEMWGACSSTTLGFDESS